MAKEPDENLPMQRVMPTLRITDYATSKSFYVDGLAFFLTQHAGDCPAGGVVHLYVPEVTRGSPSSSTRVFG